MLKLAGGVGLVFTSLVIVVWSAIGTRMLHRDLTLRDYWAATLVFVIITSLTVITLSWPEVYRQITAQLAEADRNKADSRQYRQMWTGEKAKAAQSTEADAEAERQYRWHRFWSDALEYAAENGFHYRGNFDKILRYEGWYGGMAMPFVRAGWLRPVAQAIRTEPAEGWTATRMLRELAAGTPPPYPDGEPPEWKQTARQNTPKHGETVQFASEHENRP